MGLEYLRDPSPTGMSDHEPFEKAGIPSVWIEYREDSSTHGPGDSFSHVEASRVQSAGELVQGFIEQYLTPSRIASLVAR